MPGKIEAGKSEIQDLKFRSDLTNREAAAKEVQGLPKDISAKSEANALPDEIRSGKINGSGEAIDSIREKAYYDDNGNQFEVESHNREQTENFEANLKEVSGDRVREIGEPIQNKIDGLAREHEVEKELNSKYPESEGYSVMSEAYLRDENGNIVKDPITGEARRIDFVVIKDGKVVDSVEVTSKTADKTEQTAKENRIRENGGNYIRDENGNLVRIPDEVRTRIERRD